MDGLSADIIIGLEFTVLFSPEALWIYHRGVRTGVVANENTLLVIEVFCLRRWQVSQVQMSSRGLESPNSE